MIGNILKSNGNYTHISNIKNNDYIININGKPKKVINIEKIKIKRNTEIFKIKNKNWYENIYIKDNVKILNLESLPCWKDLKTLEKSNSNYSMITTNIDWDLPNLFEHKFTKYHIKPSYKLGYIFGLYLQIGYTNKYNGICFNIDIKNKFIVDKIIQYFNQLFGINPMVIILETQDKKISIVSIVDEDLFDIFEEFYSKENYNILPHLYKCKNKEYNLGLYDSFKHYKSGFNSHNYNLNAFTSLISEKELHYHNVITTFKEKKYLCSLMEINYYITDLNLDFYKIKTEENENTSFILNNIGIKYFESL